MLLQSARTHNLPKIKQAVASGEDINQVNQRGKTALHLVLMGTTSKPIVPEIIQFLLENGANPNLADKKGFTPLLLLVNGSLNENSPVLTQLLLDFGANVNAKSKKGDNSLEILLNNSRKEINFEVASLLLRAGVQFQGDQLKSPPAFTIAARGNVPLMQIMLEKGLEINQTDRWKTKLLVEAARHGKLEMVCFLLKPGANWDYFQPERPKEHLFFYACKFGWSSVIQFLQNHHFDFHKNPILLREAVNLIMRSGEMDLLKLLESFRVNLLLPAPGSDPALKSAIISGKSKVFNYVLKKSADLEERDAEGNTALLSSVNALDLKSLQKLLEHGADLHAVNHKNRNALWLAVHHSYLKIFDFLLTKDLDINQACTETGHTPLIEAALIGNEHMVRELLKAGADPAIHAKNGRTAAITAWVAGHKALIDLLGGIHPHFTPFAAPDDRIYCAYCGKLLTQSMIDHNYCEPCKAYYCDQHYPWSGFIQRYQFYDYGARYASCPNGHQKSEEYADGYAPG
ncbi:MAG: ankyrin repeat domain-containing protein [Bacteroidia bacterium]|nr:ankyrin repeat domain-containing protein [Bacteroidia bacterium]